MILPTHEECLDYFEEYKVPDNIKQHCITVWQAARTLGIHLEQAGVPVNQRLLESLAILHDLFKMVSIRDFGTGVHAKAELSDEQRKMWIELRERFPGMHEGLVAHLIFKDKYPQFAVALKNVCNPGIENPTLEEGIVHYCDWRVFQNSIVTIPVRLEYLKKHYGRDPAVWDSFARNIERIEERIFSSLSFSPEELNEKVQERAAA